MFFFSQSRYFSRFLPKYDSDGNTNLVCKVSLKRFTSCQNKKSRLHILKQLMTTKKITHAQLLSRYHSYFTNHTNISQCAPHNTKRTPYSRLWLWIRCVWLIPGGEVVSMIQVCTDFLVKKWLQLMNPSIWFIFLEIHHDTKRKSTTTTGSVRYVTNLSKVKQQTKPTLKFLLFLLRSTILVLTSLLLMLLLCCCCCNRYDAILFVCDAILLYAIRPIPYICRKR